MALKKYTGSQKPVLQNLFYCPLYLDLPLLCPLQDPPFIAGLTKPGDVGDFFTLFQ
jgi:hypothetical protein